MFEFQKKKEENIQLCMPCVLALRPYNVIVDAIETKNKRHRVKESRAQTMWLHMCVDVSVWSH